MSHAETGGTIYATALSSQLSMCKLHILGVFLLGGAETSTYSNSVLVKYSNLFLCIQALACSAKIKASSPF